MMFMRPVKHVQRERTNCQNSNKMTAFYRNAVIFLTIYK